MFKNFSYYYCSKSSQYMKSKETIQHFKQVPANNKKKKKKKVPMSTPRPKKKTAEQPKIFTSPKKKKRERERERITFKKKIIQNSPAQICNCKKKKEEFQKTSTRPSINPPLPPKFTFLTSFPPNPTPCPSPGPGSVPLHPPG